MSVCRPYVCSNGEVIELYDDQSGVATGYARICNPYFDGDIHWKMSDGDTVCGCKSTDAGAMLVQDAYQLWYEREFQESQYWAEVERQAEAYQRELEENHWWASIEELYRVQDLLSV
jgi:hypothetical protein